MGFFAMPTLKPDELDELAKAERANKPLALLAGTLADALRKIDDMNAEMETLRMIAARGR